MLYLKKFFPLLFIFSLGFTTITPAQEQGYESIFGDSLTVWKSHYVRHYNYVDSIYCNNKDTVIQGTSYKIINATSEIKFGREIEGFLREDTLEGKLWYLATTDTTEKLIFDLSLTEKDSFFIHDTTLGKRYRDTPPGWQKVDSVYNDSNGNKIIEFNLRQDYCRALSLKFIEGHGPTFGFGYKNDHPTGKECEYFICHTKSSDQQNIFMYGDFIRYNSCPSKQVVGLKSAESVKKEVKVYPNPATNFLRIKANNPRRLPFKLMLYSVQGKKIHKHSIFNQKAKLNIRYLEPGIYYYEVYGSGGRLLNRNKVLIK